MINHTSKRSRQHFKIFPWKQLGLRMGCVWAQQCLRWKLVLLSPTSHGYRQNHSGNEANQHLCGLTQPLQITWLFPSLFRQEESQAVILQICPCTQIIWRRWKSFVLFNYFVLFHTKKMKWPNDFFVWLYFGHCDNWKCRTNQWHLWLKFISVEYPKGVISEE